MHDSFHEQGVESPGKGCADGQDSTLGVDMQNKLSVQHHHHHAQEGKDGAENLLPVQPFVLIEDGQEKGGNQRAGAHQDCHIGCQVIDQGHILRQEIKRASQNSQGKAGQLIRIVPAPETLIGNEPYQGISQQETVKEDVGRHQSGIQQHLGRDEGLPPNHDHEQGREMPQKLIRITFTHAPFNFMQR